MDEVRARMALFDEAQAIVRGMTRCTLCLEPWSEVATVSGVTLRTLEQCCGAVEGTRLVRRYDGLCLAVPV
jgi:hypothetical protein